MDKCRINIVFTEPSDIVFEGISNLLLKSESHYYIFRVKDLDELTQFCIRENPDIVIINPVAIQNRISDFIKLKKSFSHVSWIGLIYSFFDDVLINRFTSIINITDTAEIIAEKISSTLEKCNSNSQEQDELSERETDVLVLLVKGLSNKEIADKLNISVHTVITHRKNIIEKTGIKSLPGLTIYAISKKITPLTL